MTLGGLALAVVSWWTTRLSPSRTSTGTRGGRRGEPSILKGSQEITIPALVRQSRFVSCSCRVPAVRCGAVSVRTLAEAVVFAMLMFLHPVATLIDSVQVLVANSRSRSKPPPPGPMRGSASSAASRRVETDPRRLQSVRPHSASTAPFFMTVFLGMAFASMLLIPFLGRNFFPEVDADRSSCTCAVRPACAWKIPRAWSTMWKRPCRDTIPSNEIASVVDNVGLPVSSINLTYGIRARWAAATRDILVSLRKTTGKPGTTVRTLREKLPQRFPGATFSFLPADMSARILNLAPRRRSTPDRGPSPKNQDVANQMLASLRPRARAGDLRIQQLFNQPELRLSPTAAAPSSSVQSARYRQRLTADAVRQRQNRAHLLAQTTSRVCSTRW